MWIVVVARDTARHKKQEQEEGTAVMTVMVWDLSDRRVVGQLRRQAVSDALDALAELWPDQMPEDGNLERFADEKTVEFLQRSQAIPREAFTMSPDSPMRHYFRQVGNIYYWAFLDRLVEVINDRIRATYRIPPRTTPLLRRQPHARTQRNGHHSQNAQNAQNGHDTRNSRTNNGHSGQQEEW